MAKYVGPVCKLCRREGAKLFLKGERCYTDKCSFDRRPYPPGQHGQRRMKFTEYGVRLREKQKVRRMYGVVEKQFRGYFKAADQAKGVTGENFLNLLERRLDNVVFRFGFARTRAEARQLVLHRHFLVNGKRVNIPSYRIQAGDTIEVREKSGSKKVFEEAGVQSASRVMPEWLVREEGKLAGKVASLPFREALTLPIQEQLIVEYYSR